MRTKPTTQEQEKLICEIASKASDLQSIYGVSKWWGRTSEWHHNNSRRINEVAKAMITRVKNNH